LARRIPEGTPGQGSNNPHTTSREPIDGDPRTPGARGTEWVALPNGAEYNPSEQAHHRVLISPKQNQEVQGTAKQTQIRLPHRLEGRVPQHQVRGGHQL
jgi:hypothetical protein